MPQAGAAAFASWLFQSGTYAYYAAYAIAYVAISAAIVYGAMEVMGPDMGAGQNDSLSGRLSMYRDSFPPRRIIYGQCRVSGPMSFAATNQWYVTDEKDDMLHYEVVLAGHEIEEFVEVWLNDAVANLSTVYNTAWPHKFGSLIYDLQDTDPADPDGVPRYRPGATPYSETCMLKLHDGSAGQIADYDAVRNTWDGEEGRNSDDVGNGVAYIYAVHKLDREVYTSGWPTVSAVVKGKNDIYDPRDLSTGYSDNPALCLANWLVTPKDEGGGGWNWERHIDEDALVIAANICDELVDTYENGVQSKRYVIGGAVLTTEDKHVVIQKMLDTMLGTMEKVNGKWYMRAGKYVPATMTLTEGDWIEPARVDINRGVRDSYNAIKPVLATPDAEWQQTDVAEVIGEIPQAIVTVDDVNDKFSQGAVAYSNGDRVRFDVWTGIGFDDSLLITGVLPDVHYFVVNSDASWYQIATTRSADDRWDDKGMGGGWFASLNATLDGSQTNASFKATLLGTGSFDIRAGGQKYSAAISGAGHYRVTFNVSNFTATVNPSLQAWYLNAAVYTALGTITGNGSYSFEFDVTETGIGNILRFVGASATGGFDMSGMVLEKVAYNNAIDIGAFSIVEGRHMIAFKDPYLTQDGARVRRDFKYMMLNDTMRAIRLAFASLKRSRNEIVMHVVASMKAFDLLIGDAVYVIDNERGFYAVGTSTGLLDMAITGLVTHVAHVYSDNQPLQITDVDLSGFTLSTVVYVQVNDVDSYYISRYPSRPFDPNLTSEYMIPAEASEIAFSEVSGKLFYVGNWSLKNVGGALGIGLTLTSMNDDDWDWDNGYVTEPASYESVFKQDPRLVDKPRNLTAASGTDHLFKAADGTVHTQVKLAWRSTGLASVRSGGQYEIQYRASNGTTIFLHTFDTSTDGWSAYGGAVVVQSDSHLRITNAGITSGAALSTFVGVVGQRIRFTFRHRLISGSGSSQRIQNNVTDANWSLAKGSDYFYPGPEWQWHEFETDILSASGYPVTLDDGTDTFELDDVKIELVDADFLPNDWYPAAIVDGSVTEAYLRGLKDDKAYKFRIRAINSIGATSEWLEDFTTVLVDEDTYNGDFEEGTTSFTNWTQSNAGQARIEVETEDQFEGTRCPRCSLSDALSAGWTRLYQSRATVGQKVRMEGYAKVGPEMYTEDYSLDNDRSRYQSQGITTGAESIAGVTECAKYAFAATSGRAGFAFLDTAPLISGDTYSVEFDYYVPLGDAWVGKWLQFGSALLINNLADQAVAIEGGIWRTVKVQLTVDASTYATWAPVKICDTEADAYGVTTPAGDIYYKNTKVTRVGSTPIGRIQNLNNNYADGVILTNQVWEKFSFEWVQATDGNVGPVCESLVAGEGCTIWVDRVRIYALDEDHTVIGKTEPPVDPTGVSWKPLGEQGIGVFWDQSPDIDFKNMILYVTDLGGYAITKVDGTTDELTCAANFVDDDVIYLDYITKDTPLDIPPAFDVLTPHYVVNASGSIFQISLTQGGAAIDFYDPFGPTYIGSQYYYACRFSDTVELRRSTQGNSLEIQTAIPQEQYFAFIKAQDTSGNLSNPVAVGRITTALVTNYFQTPHGTASVLPGLFSQFQNAFFQEAWETAWTGGYFAFLAPNLTNQEISWGKRGGFTGSGSGTVYCFQRATSAPAVPTGTGYTPTGWSAEPPAGTDRLWMCEGDTSSSPNWWTQVRELTTPDGGIPQTI